MIQGTARYPCTDGGTSCVVIMMYYVSTRFLGSRSKPSFRDPEDLDGLTIFESAKQVSEFRVEHWMFDQDGIDPVQTPRKEKVGSISRLPEGKEARTESGIKTGLRVLVNAARIG